MQDQLLQLEMDWKVQKGPVQIGKDVLELLSTSMYLDPLVIYREYIQNSADSVEEARKNGLLKPGNAGAVRIEIDYSSRTIVIRDNGVGVEDNLFSKKMTSIGTSTKRGTESRGFRGVGRLAGLGFCQEVVFRTRSNSRGRVHELSWDCQKIKSILRSNTFEGDLEDVVKQAVKVRSIAGRHFPSRFFEVELRKVTRHRNDDLLNPLAVHDYLSQVAPVPFSPGFQHSNKILSILEPYVSMVNLNIQIAGMDSPVYRPYRNTFEPRDGVSDRFNELELVEVPALDEGTAAVGWVLHHGYHGSIADLKLKGIRLRSGNIQVGDSSLLEDLFAERRFNSWAVGEVHIIDRRITPNGRRDHYEQSTHFDNVLNHLSPIAQNVSTRCRKSSIRRNLLRQFSRLKTGVVRNLDICKQGTLSVSEQKRLHHLVEKNLTLMEKIASHGLLSAEVGNLNLINGKLKNRAKRVVKSHPEARKLKKLPAHKKRIYNHLFSLIYRCSQNQVTAQLLVDRILKQLDANVSV